MVEVCMSDILEIAAIPWQTSTRDLLVVGPPPKRGLARIRTSPASYIVHRTWTQLIRELDNA
jgi:hypothetical protein